MPKVSIIVPNYNHAPFLEQRLESILSQTFQDYELILLDDCSTDGSLDIIHRYKNKCPQIRVFLNDRNSGSPFKQWDFGVRQAGGDYIWVAESDDGAAVNFLDEMVPILEKNSHVGLAHCDALIINDKGQSMASLSDNYSSSEERKTTDYINNGKAEIENRLCVTNTINNVSGVIFRKASYINAGFADVGMQYCGDWFLYLRMLLATDSNPAMTRHYTHTSELAAASAVNSLPAVMGDMPALLPAKTRDEELREIIGGMTAKTMKKDKVRALALLNGPEKNQ